MADYLFDERKFVVELKTLYANPKAAVGRKLREGLNARGVVVFGQVGVGRILDDSPDSGPLKKTLLDTTGRRIRSNLKDANQQICSTKEFLNLSESAGLVVLANDSVALIDAPSTAYVIRDCLERHDENVSHIDCVLSFIEAHRIRLPNGELGHPLMLVIDSQKPLPESKLRLLGSMIEYWAAWNQRKLYAIPHEGKWDALYSADRGPIIETY